MLLQIACLFVVLSLSLPAQAASELRCLLAFPDSKPLADWIGAGGEIREPNVSIKLSAEIMNAAKLAGSIVQVKYRNEFLEGPVAIVINDHAVLKTPAGIKTISLKTDAAHLTRLQSPESYRSQFETLKSQLTNDQRDFVNSAQTALGSQSLVKIRVQRRPGQILIYTGWITSVASVQPTGILSSQPESIGVRVVLKDLMEERYTPGGVFESRTSSTAGPDGFTLNKIEYPKAETFLASRQNQTIEIL